MVRWVVEFSGSDTKLVRHLSKNQHDQRKLLNFENRCDFRICYQKMLITKNGLLDWYSLIEKK